MSDVPFFKEVKTLDGHKYPVFSVVFHPNGKRLVSGDENGVIMIWNLRDNTNSALPGHADAVLNVTISHDGKWLATASVDHIVRVYSMFEYKPNNTIEGEQLQSYGVWFGFPNELRHDGGVYAINFSPSQDLLASGGIDTTIKLWSNLENTTWSQGTVLMVFNGKNWQSVKNFINTVNSEQTLLAFAVGKTVVLWDLVANMELARFQKHLSKIDSMAFSFDKQLLISRSGDSVRIWNLETRQEVAELSRHVGYSQDRKWLILGDWDTTEVWDSIEYKKIATLEPMDGTIILNPDGKPVKWNNRKVIPSTDTNSFVNLLGLLDGGCEKLKNYLHNPLVNEEERTICDAQYRTQKNIQRIQGLNPY